MTRALHACGFETLEEKVKERLPDQGVLSTDCGMNCHKQCKDLVVFECKKRAKNSTAPTENSTSVGPTSNLCSLGAKDLHHGKQALGMFILGSEGRRIRFSGRKDYLYPSYL